jgi:uncharacterized membrane protein
MKKDVKEDALKWFLNDIVETIESTLDDIESGKLDNKGMAFIAGYAMGELEYTRMRIKNVLDDGRLLKPSEEDPEDE